MCNPSGTTSRRALIRCRSNSGNKPSWRNALPHIAEPRRKPSPGKTSSNAFSNDSSPVGRCLGWKFGPRQNSMPLRRRCGTTANVKVLGRNSSLHFAPPLPGRGRAAATFAQRVGDLFPGCPIEEQRAIGEHACEKYSGRIGRRAAAKELQASAADLAVRAHIRHVHHAVRRIARKRRSARGSARSGSGGRREVPRDVARWQIMLIHVGH